MKALNNPKEIAELMHTVKYKGSSFLSNFFIEEKKINYWITQQLLSFKETESGVLFFRKSDSFYYLYYATSSLDNLKLLLKNDLPDIKLVTDIIGEEKNIEPISKTFIDEGFFLYAQLHRYTRINITADKYYNSDEVSFSQKEDGVAIAKLLKDNFDAVAEQVPALDEVEILIAEKKIIQIKESNIIKGFLVRTFIGQTSILNNFLVDKKFRGSGIGSKLLQHYFFESKNTKRMILWALSDNDIALKIYKKYGYHRNTLSDHIMTNIHEQHHQYIN